MNKLLSNFNSVFELLAPQGSCRPLFALLWSSKGFCSRQRLLSQLSPTIMPKDALNQNWSVLAFNPFNIKADIYFHIIRYKYTVYIYKKNVYVYKI